MIPIAIVKRIPMAIIWKLAALISSSWNLPSDELALKNELSRLESSWSSLDVWLNVWTLIVVIGVAVELIVIVAEYRHAMHDFGRGIIRPPDRPNRWLLAFGLLGAGFVAIGVAGEFGVHIKAGRIETGMRDATGKLVGIAEGRASDANSEAGTAKDDAAHAQERTKELEKEAAQLRKDAEAEHLARVKLEKQIQPRTISESDRKKLGEVLRKFGPSLKGRKVKISSQSGETESMAFSLEIMDILNRAGIEVDPSGLGRLLPVGAVYMGLNVTGPTSDEMFIRSLATGLSTSADNTAVHAEWNPKYSEVGIMVGVKPIAGLTLSIDWLHQ